VHREPRSSVGNDFHSFFNGRMLIANVLIVVCVPGAESTTSAATTSSESTSSSSTSTTTTTTASTSTSTTTTTTSPTTTTGTTTLSGGAYCVLVALHYSANIVINVLQYDSAIIFMYLSTLFTVRLRRDNNCMCFS